MVHNALMVVVSQSVCPAVCLVAEPKSRTEGLRELKIDRKEAQGTGDP